MSELATTSSSAGQEVSEQAVPSRSLNRQIVLDEDEYTAALSQIIARDFFPSLVHIDATNNYLDALSTADPHLIQQSVRQIQELATPSNPRLQPFLTPSQTPWAAEPSDTPLRTPLHSGDRPFKRPRYDTSLSLDSFQARYTSEDNSSFTQILDDENVKRKEKFGWAWDAQKRAEEQKGKLIEMRERMLIEPAAEIGVREKMVIEAPKPAGLIENTKPDSSQSQPELTSPDEEGNESDRPEKNTLALVERSGGDEEVVDVMAPKKDKRSTTVDTWKFKVNITHFFTYIQLNGL